MTPQDHCLLPRRHVRHVFPPGPAPDDDQRDTSPPVERCTRETNRSGPWASVGVGVGLIVAPISAAIAHDDRAMADRVLRKMDGQVARTQ